LAEACAATTMKPIVATDHISQTFAGSPLQGVRGKMPVQVPGPREATGEKQLTVMALGVQTFDGSPLEVRGMVLTEVTEDDMFRIAVARYLGEFKPSASVPCEVDTYIPVQ
jgi:hypothetical protein